MADELKAAGVDVQFQSTGDLLSVLIGFLPNLLFLLVIGGLFYWSYRSVQRGQGQAMRKRSFRSFEYHGAKGGAKYRWPFLCWVGIPTLSVTNG